jgi:hypothetical protein
MTFSFDPRDLDLDAVDIPAAAYGADGQVESCAACRQVITPSPSDFEPIWLDEEGLVVAQGAGAPYHCSCAPSEPDNDYLGDGLAGYFGR